MGAKPEGTPALSENRCNQSLVSSLTEGVQFKSVPL